MARAVIKFNLSTIPEGVSIKEAVLSFYVFDQGISLGSGDPVNAPKAVYKITEAWNASNIIWLKAPKFDSTNAVDQSSNTQTPVWEDYDVTPVIKDIIENGTENHGFMLKFQSETDYKGARIHSSDCAEDKKSFRPKLTIDYENTAINPNKPGITGVEDIVFEKTGSMVTFYVPFKDTYQIALCNAAGNTIKILSSSGIQRYSVNNNSLSQGIYFIRVVSSDRELIKKYCHIR